MKVIQYFLLVMVVLLVTSSSNAQSIRFRGSDGWGIGGMYDQFFNAFNIETFKGTVTKIDTLTPLQDMGMGIKLEFKNSFGQEEIVHLGPAWFVLYQDMNLSKNDEVEIRGARATINGKKCVMASEVKRKDKILKLREVDGIPMWCAWRRK